MHLNKLKKLISKDYPYEIKEPLNTIDTDCDMLPNYAEATQPRVFDKSVSNLEEASLNSKIDDARFIKSNLIINNDSSTRTLEIKMDKRIDLTEFKNHVGSFMNLTNENFRVFRLCPNNFDCELTSCDNQFSYLTQNTKFVIKLGRPLKYGEYMIQIFRLNVEKNTVGYLCDFMVLHGLSVLNHKELLCDDLRDECNLDTSVNK